MIEFLIFYFVAGAMFGSWMWFSVGRNVPDSEHVKAGISKQRTLFILTVAWPVALMLLICLVIDAASRHRGRD